MQREFAVSLAVAACAWAQSNPYRGEIGVLKVQGNVYMLVGAGANIAAQVLATDPDIGYLVMDLDQDVSNDVKKAVAALETSIKTRILY